MKRIGLLTLGLAFALSFGLAQTDSTSTDTSTSTSMSAGMLGDFSSYDADADGALTAEELGQGLLAAYDTNVDGSVDQTEFDAMAGMSSDASSTDSAATTDSSTSTDSAATTDSTSTDSASTDSSSTDTSTADSSTTTDTSTATASAGTVGDFTSLDANADGLLDAAELGQGFVTAYDTSGAGSLSQTDFDALASALGGSSDTATPTQ